MGLFGSLGLKSAFSAAALAGLDIIARSFTATQAANLNAFTIQTAGARLKLSSGGTTDYFYSPGGTDIVAAGGLQVVGTVESSKAAGSNAFTVTTEGARYRFGAGANQYLQGVFGVAINTPAALTADGGLQSRSATGSLSIGTSGDARFTIDVLGNVVIGDPTQAGTGGNGAITIRNFVDDSATTGSRTVNAVRGINAFAAAATAITITNSFVVATSTVLCVLQTNDATARIANVVPGAGSFTINLTAAATGTTKVGWLVLN